MKIKAEFFQDANVRFPAQPRLVEGISIYDAPTGLGVQFRGGPSLLVIKGRNSSLVFQHLRPYLNGEYEVDEILEAISAQVSLKDVTSVLKILHSNGLLRNGTRTSISQTPYLADQITYYERLLGKTGFNDSGTHVVDTLAQTKVLILGSGYFCYHILEMLNRSGIKQVGLLAERLPEHFEEYFKSNDQHMQFDDLSQKSPEEVLELVSESIENYQYVITGFDNGSQALLQSINRVALQANIPVLFANHEDLFFRIGPYVIPHRTACYECYLLRRNSYQDDAVYEHEYQEGLVLRGRISDEQIQGHDLPSCLMAASYLVSEFIKLISGYAHPTLINQIWEYNALSGQIITKNIIRVPNCPECSTH